MERVPPGLRGAGTSRGRAAGAAAGLGSFGVGTAAGVRGAGAAAGKSPQQSGLQKTDLL